MLICNPVDESKSSKAVEAGKGEDEDEKFRGTEVGPDRLLARKLGVETGDGNSDSSWIWRFAESDERKAIKVVRFNLVFSTFAQPPYDSRPNHLGKCA
jgi:hypothetical protein